MDNGEWTCGSLLTYADGSCFICCEIYPGKLNKLQVDPDTVGQYTGLTDRNGKKIFEGDLLKRLPSKNEGPYEVYWENEDYAWRIRLDHYQPDDFIGFDSEEWVVIGNMWDNPELLEVKE